jgi:DNA primase
LSKTGVSKVVDLVERTIPHRSDRFAEPEASAIDVETGWRHVLALHQRQDGLERSLKAAEEAWYRDCTPEAEARLLDLKRQLALLGSMEHADNMDVLDSHPGGAEKQAS